MPIFRFTRDQFFPKIDQESSAQFSHVRTTYRRQYHGTILPPKMTTFNMMWNTYFSRFLTDISYEAENREELERKLIENFRINTPAFLSRPICFLSETEVKKQIAFIFAKIIVYYNLYACVRDIHSHGIGGKIDLVGSRSNNGFFYNRRQLILSHRNSQYILRRLFITKNVLFIPDNKLNDLLQPEVYDNNEVFWNHIIEIYKIVHGTRVESNTTVSGPRTLEEEYVNRTEELEEEITTNQIAAMLTNIQDIPADMKKAIYDVLISIQTSDSEEEHQS